MDYLSVFDGHPIYPPDAPRGLFIVGLTKDFAFKDKKESANLVLDDKRLLITLDGKDRLKAMVLGQLADKISENCAKNLYKVKKRLEAFGYFIHQLR